MNKGRLAGGIICLLVAALLAILSWRLPAEELMFMVGGINIPMIILAVLGIVLLILARKQQRA